MNKPDFSPPLGSVGGSDVSTGACSLGSAFVVSLLGAAGGIGAAAVDGSSVVVSVVGASSSGGGALTVA